jgi:hypothetical protein
VARLAQQPISTRQPAALTGVGIVLATVFIGGLEFRYTRLSNKGVTVAYPESHVEKNH